MLLSLLPACPWMGRGPDRQHARRGLDFDLIRKSRNLEWWLRETDAPTSLGPPPAGGVMMPAA